MIINILLLILFLLRLVISIRLFTTARQNNLPNLNWLAVHFFALVIGLPFAPTVGNPLGDFSFSIWLFVGVASLLGQFGLIAFNHATFYQGRKSPTPWFWTAFIITGILTLYGIAISESNYAQSPWVAAYIPSQLLLWGWHARVASQARAGLEQESAVEDWVKSRYQLIVAYSIIISIGVVASFIRITVAGGSSVSPLGNLMGLITLVMQIASVTLQFLVWVMPEGFRKWLNRNQQAHTEERIHEQALAILNILGSAMADGTGLTKMMALFAIRKTIGQEIKTEDANKIEARAISLGYNEWLELLTNPELGVLVRNSGTNINPQNVLNNAKHVLIEKQSLFTMQAK